MVLLRSKPLSFEGTEEMKNRHRKLTIRIEQRNNNPIQANKTTYQATMKLSSIFIFGLVAIQSMANAFIVSESRGLNEVDEASMVEADVLVHIDGLNMYDLTPDHDAFSTYTRDPCCLMLILPLVPILTQRNRVQTLLLRASDS